LFANIDTMLILATALITGGLVYPGFMLLVKKKSLAQTKTLDQDLDEPYNLKRVTEN